MSVRVASRPGSRSRSPSVLRQPGGGQRGGRSELPSQLRGGVVGGRFRGQAGPPPLGGWTCRPRRWRCPGRRPGRRPVRRWCGVPAARWRRWPGRRGCGGRAGSARRPDALATRPRPGRRRRGGPGGDGPPSPAARPPSGPGRCGCPRPSWRTRPRPTPGDPARPAVLPASRGARPGGRRRRRRSRAGGRSAAGCSQSLRRSAFGSRTPSSLDSSVASDGVDEPRKPAASWVSNRWAGTVPQTARRTSRSWLAAWTTASPGPSSSSAIGAMSTASGSTSTTWSSQASWTRASSGK